MDQAKKTLDDCICECPECQQGLHSDAKTAYEQGRADAWRWIPVSERLPTKEPHEELEVLTYNVNCGMSEVARYECGDLIGEEFSIGVTHWLPIILPGDPK